MRAFLVFALAASATAQLKFGSDPTEAPKKDVNTRLGLLGTSLGLSPTAEQNSGSSSSGGQSSAFTAQSSGQTPTGRVPSGGEFTGSFSSCCCVPLSEQCGDPLGRDIDYDYDLVGSGLIDPRLKPLREESAKRTQSAKDGLGLRIVNRPNANTNSQINTCPIGQKACCYDPSVNHASFGRSCIAPGSTANQFESVRYGCNEQVVNSGKQCGTRNFPAPAVLSFPTTAATTMDEAPRKVVTAAHKLKNVQQNELLKIRVGEYDASGFNPPETVQHEEYTIVRLLKHPQFNAGRLSNDVAILYTDRDINLNNPNVNTACLPSCRDQFSHQFNNGTGVRCWVAGWGKNEVDGSFQFIQHKVDLPLVENNSCNNKLKNALNAQRAGSGNRFSLSTSEICAGGQVGKDACTGDGGSPLVCQGLSGRWTVVGLVTWGVGCASDVPGVYARMSHFTQWINEN